MRTAWHEGKQVVYESEPSRWGQGKCADRSLDNLYCAKGKVIREMSKNQWWFDNPELTLTAIKYCELHFLLKDAGGGEA